MKSFIARAYLLVLALCQAGNSSQSDADIGTSVNDLVGKHCLGGIPYQAAHALGPEALPYLFNFLRGLAKRPFWMNFILTIGFICVPDG